jgi:hypothetical protein
MAASRGLARAALALLVVGWAAPAGAAQPFRYPEGKHGKGELRYVHGLPVLVVAGSPEEIGEQVGVLALKPAAGGARLLKDYLKQRRLEALWPLLVRLGRQAFARVPAPYRREVEAMARASGLDLDLLVVGNSLDELRRLAGCSGLVVGPERSATGGPLFGRNWDFPPLKGLAQYSLVIVYRPAGKRAFVTVGFPRGLCGGSAMNADGLALGVNEVLEAADRSPRLDWKGVPMLVATRQILEECGTCAEVEKWLRGHRLASYGLLVACDRSGGAAFEVTTRTVRVRRAEDGLCVGTNHFRCPGLAVRTECPRYTALAAAKGKRLAVADVARKMGEANQGAWTLHSMVFETRPLRLHLALGDGIFPATGRPLRALDLGPLLKGGPGR